MKKGLLIIVGLLSLSIPAFSLSGTVVSVSGKVEIQTTSGWRALARGETVDEGRVISTGFKSQATIRVAGSNIVVNQLSRLTLEQLTESNSSHDSEVFLNLGSISADVQSSQNKRVNFQVNTPVATASVRGTGFDMGQRNISVGRGLINYSGTKGKAVAVPGGSTSGVSSKRGNSINPITSNLNRSLGTQNDDSFTVPSVATASYIAATQSTNQAAGTATLVVTVVIP